MNKMLRQIYGVLIALFVAVVCLTGCNSKIVDITVTEKAIRIKNSSSAYTIFTDMGVFSNHDEFLALKFNSADLYAELKPGTCYRVKTWWWRIPVFSKYPNIIKILGECNE